MQRIPVETQFNTINATAARRIQMQGTIRMGIPQIGTLADDRMLVTESVRFMFELGSIRSAAGLLADWDNGTSRACKTGQS